MIVFILLSIYSTLGVSYLLGRRVWLWCQRRKYLHILEEAKLTPLPDFTLSKEGVEEQSAIVLPYEREYVERETVEEREWRVERDYMSKKVVEAV